MITTPFSTARAPSPNAGLTRRLAGTCAVLLLLAGAQTAAATQIYRSVDEAGNVVFSDVPPPPGRSGSQVELQTPNTIEPPATNSGISVADWLAGQSQQAEAAATQQRYESLRLTHPPHDTAIRENAGNVPVTAELHPELKPGHRVQLYLDGALLHTAPQTEFLLENVDRGTHAVELRVVDDAGNALISSGISTFHLQRRSVILQPPPAKRAP
ncbi:MAG: DUF4124 domain-containing protein [Pseudomonadales bacterium]